MVRASTHMEFFSLHGWTSSTRYRAIQCHHVPFYLPPPDHHHLPDALHLSKGPQVAPFPQDHDSPWDSLGSLGAPGAHLAPPPQSEDESQKLESRNDNDNKALAKGSPFALAMASLKVGCQVELSLCCLRQSHRFHLYALAGIKGDSTSGQVHFDSDSFPIRINNHASYCVANSPHLFDDLILSDVGNVDGTNEGLAILGKGTFKFSISDDDGRVHRICIPNSLYLPKLQGCLLSPQHWAQEAGDNETWMGNFAHCCILHWLGGRKTVPFHASINTPIFHMASSSSMYRAFAATFEAMEAPFFRRETTLQLPGPWFPREYVIPKEFVAEEDLH
jgi:hypothetical protein